MFMYKSINMVNYRKETKIYFDNVRIIIVESGKELNEKNGRGFKSTHYYYAIFTNVINYFDTKDWFVSFNC